MTKTNEKTTETVADPIKEAVDKFDNTSKKIRYLVSSAPDSAKAVAYAYNQLKRLGVTTKNGGEIRYQHVRNVALMKLTSK